ncbi:MAG TPA: PQQ-binding-like beta-propeller repeat protein [Ktedonobacteraceae bacterium]|jgi:outer membrane protein assembly factor BamB|nr:PQQ-binding-like beta-propeller repeat protein [Ktedonobacteraceae bacterium]
MQRLQRHKPGLWIQRRYALHALMAAGILALLFATFGSNIGAHAASIASPQSKSAGDWTTYLYDKNHSGYNSAEKIINPGSAKNLKQHWMIPGKNTISTQPVVTNGLVYWGAWDGNEYATHLDGSKAWTTFIGKTTDPSCGGATLGVLSTGTVARVKSGGKTTSMLLVGGGDAQFYALNANTGAILWKTRLGTSPDNIIWASPVYYQGSVYIGLASFGDCPLVQGKVFKLKASNGTIENTFNVVPDGCTGAGVWGSVTYDTSDNSLYFATGNGNVCGQSEPYAEAIVKLKASDLSVISSWQVPKSQQVSDGDFGSTPTLFTATINGSVHKLVGVGNKNGYYYAFDRTNLSKGPVWEDQVAIGGSGPESGQGTISPSAWDGKMLYVGGGNTTIKGQNCQGGLRAVNPATGAYIWENCLTDGPAIGAVTVVPGVVAIGEGTAIDLIAAANGSNVFKAWDNNNQSKYYGAASISNGVLYIGNKDGNFYAYGT